MTTQHQSNTPPHPGDATDPQLDALLATRPIPPNPHLTERILRTLNSDATLDTLLRHHPIAPAPERTEKILHAIQRTRQRQTVLRWLTPTAIAATLLFALVHTAHTPPAPPPTEERLAKMLTDDPALAALLDPLPPLTLNPETASIIAGLNDNNLAWLDALTHHEI